MHILELEFVTMWWLVNMPKAYGKQGSCYPCLTGTGPPHVLRSSCDTFLISSFLVVVRIPITRLVVDRSESYKRFDVNIRRLLVM